MTRDIIDLSEFARIDIRAGTVIESTPFPRARVPAIKLRIDFGSEVGTLSSSAQLTRHYTPDQLIGKQVIAIVNLAPRSIAGYVSQALVLGLPDSDNQPVLISPDHFVQNGVKMF